MATCVELNDRPFDQAHPLWEVWLLTGALDGHVPMLIRFHHVLADGIAALLLLGTLFDSSPFDSAPDAPESESHHGPPDPSPPALSFSATCCADQSPAFAGACTRSSTRGGPSPRLGRCSARLYSSLARAGLRALRSTGRSADSTVSRSCVPTSDKPGRSHTRITRPSTTWCCARSQAEHARSSRAAENSSARSC